MSTAEQQAADFVAPREGAINVVALAANAASAAQDTGLGVDVAPTGYVTIGCNEVFYLTFGGASVAAPDIAATTGAGRTMGPFPANAPVSVRVDKDRRYFRAISASAATLRWYVSSGGREA